ncbi:MAG: hypothetical protein ACXVA7_19475, partial [Isosphaeraceae bacterium]
VRAASPAPSVAPASGPTPRPGAGASRPGRRGWSAGVARPLEDFQGGRVDLRRRPVDDPDGQVLAVADLLGEGEVVPTIERSGSQCQTRDIERLALN